LEEYSFKLWPKLKEYMTRSIGSGHWTVGACLEKWIAPGLCIDNMQVNIPSNLQNCVVADLVDSD